MTLYNHFRSKDELILAVLRRRDERFRNWFMRRTGALAGSPQERLLAMFDALQEWFDGKDFGGCMFINASAEFKAPDHPVARATAEHKRLIRGYVGELCHAAGLADPDELADGLTLLAEGAIVMAYVARQPDAGRRARKTARRLIAAAAPSPA